MKFDAAKKSLQERFVRAFCGLLPNPDRQALRVVKKRSSRVPQFETLEVRTVFAIDELIGFEDNAAVSEGWVTVRNEVQGSVRWVASDPDRDSPSPLSGSRMLRLNSPYRPGALQADQTYRLIKGDQIFIDGVFDPNATDPLGTARFIMFDALNSNNDINIWASSSKTTTWTQGVQTVPSTWGSSSPILDVRLAAVLYQNNRSAPPGDTTAYHNMNFFLDRLIVRHNSVVDGDDLANVISEDSPSGTYTGVSAFVGGFLPYTYSLDDSAGGRFWINGSGQVMTGNLGIQSSQTFNIRIRATYGTESVVSGLIPISVYDVNDPPIFNIPPDYTVSEDAAQFPVPLVGIADGDGTQQPLAVTATSSNPGLIPHPTVNYISQNSTGSLILKPIADQNGSTVITVTVTDGGLDNNLATSDDNRSTSKQFTVDVTPVNDAPVASDSATLAPTNEDNTNPPGATVSSLFIAKFNDDKDKVVNGSAANTLAGIAVTLYTADATKGQWQYSSGAGWTNLGSVTGQAAATLIPAGHLLRFVPTANFNGPAPTISALLIDDSSGTVSFTTGVNIPEKGGITRYSSATVPLNHTVTAVNDAPAASGSATLLAINEDTTDPPGATVSSLFRDNFNDDTDKISGGSVANSFAGVAVTLYTADATKGQWQYSSTAGWTNLGSVTGQAAATLIPAGHLLRFVPTANFNGPAPTISALLIDDSSGTVSFTTGVNIPEKGGITRYSSATVPLNHTVTAVNDAPVASGSATLVAINEDDTLITGTTPPGATVESLFKGNFNDSKDQVPGGSSANTLAGIAITSYIRDTSKGDWQYFDGTSWTTITTTTPISDASALTLRSVDSLRFIPASNFNGLAPSLTVRLLETPRAVISGVRVDVSTNGGTTDISSGTVVLSHSVTAVNDAPVASGSAMLVAINEDDTLITGTTPPGSTVASLFTGNFSDAKDHVPGGSSANTLAGIAITSYTRDTSKGDWQFFDGTSWTTITTTTPISDASALTLRSVDSLRFIPASNFNGLAPSLTVRLLETPRAVISGVRVDVSTNGGTTDISSGTVVLSHSVTAVNDAPVASGSAMLVAINEDDTLITGTTPPGSTVASLFTGNFSDAKDQVPGGSSANTLAGIAITSYTRDTSKGDWQYFDGTSWTTITTTTPISDTSALTLRSVDSLRFIPVSNFNGSAPALIVRLLETPRLITPGARINASTNGGSTSISEGTVVLSHSVTAVNDAPVASGSATLVAINEDDTLTTGTTPPGSTVALLFTGNFSDAKDQVPGGSSANTLAGIAITSYTRDTSKGDWQYFDGTSWTTITTTTPISDTSALTLRSVDSLRFVPASNFNGLAPTLTVRLLETPRLITPGARINASTNGGSTDISEGTVVLSHSVTAVNDAPVASDSATLAAINEDDTLTTGTTPPGSTVASLFTGNFSDAKDQVPGGSSANLLAGIAITSYTRDTSKGDWQYFDGTSWTTITTTTPISDTSALTLRSVDSLRFIPVSNFNGLAPSLTVRLLETPRAVITGARINASTNGGTTSISEGTVVLAHSVIAINDAPVASGSATLVAINEDDTLTTGTTPPGSTVALLFTGNFSDAKDQVPGGSSANTLAGIAITSYTRDTSKGDWQYFDGASWTTITTTTPISDASALTVRSVDSLRFIPASNFNGLAPSLTVRLLETPRAVITGVRVNVTTNGGTTDISEGTVVLSHRVNAVNDAPVVSGSAMLVAINEDDTLITGTTPPGSTVASLFTGNFDDSKDQVPGGSSANLLAGIAITSYTRDTSKGDWQYFDGTSWTTITTTTPISDTSALTIRSVDSLRFIPVSNFNGLAPSLTVRLLETPRAVITGARINASTNGGTTDISEGTVVLAHSVIAINDAPVASGSATLAAIKEDDTLTTGATPPGSTVAALFTGNFDDSKDQVPGGSSANTLAGVAITSYTRDTSKGDWQYFDGTSWTTITTTTPISDASALTLRSIDSLRFIPASNFNGLAPSLTVRLLETPRAVITGARINASTNGGSTDISEGTVVLAHSVIAINDAPVASDSAMLVAINEDDTLITGTTPPGSTVASLFTGNFSDAKDHVPSGSSANTLAGIAITSYTRDTSKGDWQYFDGTNWTTITTTTPISDASALTLRSIDSLRFIPASNFNGLAPSLTVRLLETPRAVITGARINASTNGGTTDISEGTVVLSHSVTAINDAPVASGSATLVAINEDDTLTTGAAPPGSTLALLFTGNFSDAKDQVPGGSSANTLAGIAITSYTRDTSKGDWQYFDGASWTTITTTTPISDASALTVRSVDSLRFIPASNFNGLAPSLTVRLLETPRAVITGVRVNVTTNGGTTDISEGTVVLSHRVNAVNDAPVVSGSAMLVAINEDDTLITGTTPPGSTVASLFTGNFSDAKDQVPSGSSANTLAGIAITSYTRDTSKGDWQYFDGTSWTTITTTAPITDASALTIRSVDSLRFIPVSNFNGLAPSLTVRLLETPRAVITGARINASTNGGTTDISEGTVVLSHSVTAVNDAPVASGSSRLAAINEDNTNPPGATVTSLFNANFTDATDYVIGGSVANKLAGIAVTLYAANPSKGHWQYSSGAGWTTLVGVTGQSAATVIPEGHLLRFLPAANFNGSAPTITALLIDDSSGPVSFTTGVNIVAKGGTTQYSASTVLLNHTVNSINDAPTDITLTPNSIPENAVANATVGTLRTVDVDTGNTFTYSFIAGLGGSDNALFRISGATLRAVPSFDYETKSSYTIRVKSTDQGGLSVEKALNINVTNVNDVPVFNAAEYEFEVENGSQRRPAMQPNNGQWKPSISRDGRVVSFVSYATNFGDVDFEMDVFAKNTRSGAVVEASNTSTGGRSNGDSFNPTLTPDGRYVVFESYASNLVPEDTGPTGDIFVRDLVSGTLTRVSTSSAGEEANGRSYSPSISDNGRFIAFRSDATNLIEGDTNNFGDVFVKDLLLGTLTRISVAENGSQGNNHSFEPIISGDGNFVVFRSYASNLVSGPDNNFEDIYRKNLSTGEIVRVNTSSSGLQGNNAVWYPTISYDGRYVSFPSTATNLVDGDTNNSWDVFVKDMVTGTTVRASTGSNGEQGDGISNYANISGDGRYVSFVSFASNLVTGDTNAKSDIFVKDLVSGLITRASTDSTGGQANDASNEAIIGASGVYVAFTSTATNLIPNDTNGVADIFVKNIVTGETTRAASQNTGVFIGTVSGSDQDAGATVSYSLAGPGADQFVLDPSSGQITLSATAIMDYDLQPTYSLIATISDGQLSSTVPVTIHVTNGTNRPSDILLSPSSIEENAGENVLVGNLSSIDPNTGDTFTYTLVDGIGDTDNTAFTIDGNQLRAISSFDYETKSTYSIRVRSTDQTDLFKEKVLTVRVIDIDEGFPLFGTAGNDAFIANYTGDGVTHSWAVTRNGVSVFNGPLGTVSLMIDGLGGTDSLDIVGRTVDDTFQLEGGQIFVNGSKLRFPRIESLKVLGGLGNDALITLTPLASGVAGAFDGGSGNDRFEAASTPNIWNVTGTDSGQLNSLFSFISTESLVGGSGDDQFILSSLGKTTGPILGGTGSDTLNLSAKTTASTINLQTNTATSTGGIGGFESLVGSSATAIIDVLIGANSSTNWVINAADAGSLTSSATGTVLFRGFESLTGGTASDNFVLTSTGSVSKVLTGGTATGIVDTLDLSSKSAALDFRVDASTSTVPGIVGSYVGLETIVGNGVAGSKVTRVNNATTSWAVNNLGQIVLSAVAYANVSEIVGSVGVDTLTGPSLASGVATWTINTANGGTLSIPTVASITFSGIDGLTGGTGDDSFEILPSGSLSGLLNGGTGAGLNSLSYEQWTTGVSVNLSVTTVGNATAVTGLTSNFQMVFGGSGNDTLRGGTAKSIVLVGLAGNDTLVGGSQRDILIGGVGADLIQSGSGDDLLVSGRTVYDTNRYALASIFSEWTSARTFASRTANIWGDGTGVRNNGENFFNSDPSDSITDTVFADSDADSLTGGLNQDWFFASLNDLTDFVGTGTSPDRQNS